MNIYVNFLAFHSLLPKNYISIDVPDGTDAGGLLRVVSEMYSEQLQEYINNEDWLLNNVLLASDHKIIQIEDKLCDGQQVTIIGQIIGG